MTNAGGVKSSIKEMFPFDWDALQHFGSEPVPNHLKRWWFCLGGTVLYLFIIQIVTGIALTFYYVPSPDGAWESVRHITQDVRFGWFIRSLHKWSASFMIVAVFLHVLRVYFTGGYRRPRQLNWLVGVLLLGTTLGFGFTGYSLIYEQESFWGATVACNLADAVPLIGPMIGDFLRGGPDVSGSTLTRFFVLHIGLLPTAIFMLIGLHIFIIRMHGVTELQFEDTKPEEQGRHFRFWPDHAMTELMIGLLMMYLLTIIALIFPPEMGPIADPIHTPEHIKPEWFFYFNFKLLKLTSLKLSVILTGAIMGVLFFWPFIEEWLQRKFKITDRFSVILGVFAFLTFLILTVWEGLSA